ncbi:hypothetical protein [Chryseobacterium taiwanense]|uniref:Lipoprotein n=1 Tax=Chryseobacterium taiwanense TaxID=363331 RepID=A0A0B4D253_9FLAO|nr:hypothetical protein [Chryseobacterium taiwanense]KIC62707.1 hypothetical protein RM51_10965 [Chryseobacterium taiwanense]
MIGLKNILTLLLLSLTLVSCEQAETKKRVDEVITHKQIENKHTKVISDSTNILTDKVENLELEYTVWGCACPQWIQSKDNENSDKTKNYLKLHFYIEPADSTIELPIYFDAFRHRIKVTGQFYEREDYPKGTLETEEPMPKAKVFRYKKLEVIDNPNFKIDSKVEQLTLIYNAISCTCAQWSEDRKREDNNKKRYYWLEPANEKLIDADRLFNGKNLPIIIKVTGRVVTENGFPKRELSKVGQDEAGKVFRYTKIEVIQNGQKK